MEKSGRIYLTGPAYEGIPSTVAGVRISHTEGIAFVELHYASVNGGSAVIHVALDSNDGAPAKRVRFEIPMTSIALVHWDE